MSTRTALVFVALIAAFALSGCGFSPVYGNYANAGRAPAVSGALDSIYIDSIPDRSGQKLRTQLMDRFYQTGRKNLADAQYRLRISGVGESIYGLGIAKDATATRSQIRLSSQFILTRAGDPEGKPLLIRTVGAVSSFNTLASQYTTLVTEEDARDQAIHDLSDQIATMLELYFTNPAAFPEPVDPAAAAAAQEQEKRDALHNRSSHTDIGDY